MTSSGVRVGSVMIWRFVLLLVLSLPARADDKAWETLKTESDLIVFMRHTQPSAGGNPLKWDTTGNCDGESMLTEAGKLHAKRIGEAFAQRGIEPVGIRSPLCRCRETAAIAFGRSPITDGELREIATADSVRTKTCGTKD